MPQQEKIEEVIKIATEFRQWLSNELSFYTENGSTPVFYTLRHLLISP